MSRWREACATVVQTLLRMLPFPARTGLTVVGRPGRAAPVLLTGNFSLTVRRVRRALRGLDAYLLVANSRGVNVWCAATGGLLTDHDVISVLRTSGIEGQVDHRRVILPQLAATGIDGAHVRRATGWRVAWGPVEASDLPAYLAHGLEATREMRTVTFPPRRRFEMAVAWAFPISLLTLVLAPWLHAATLVLAGAVWALAFALFLPFPWYARFLRPKSGEGGVAFFDRGRGGVLLALWLLYGAAAAAVLAATGRLGLHPLASWAGAGAVLVLVLGVDLTGSTPVYKSALLPDRSLRIALDVERCRGAGFCVDVCPVDVLVLDREAALAALARPEQCVQCGACIVQCPFDALWFEAPSGEGIAPETVRRYKLNLLGKRRRDAGAAHA